MVGRFEVMALLQAARAEALGYSVDEAKSFGLNRAIFYQQTKAVSSVKGTKGGRVQRRVRAEYIGDEMAYCVVQGGRKHFVMGKHILTPEGFKKKIESRFGYSYNSAWEEARAFIHSFDRETVESQHAFYKEIYKPVRDELADIWTKRAKDLRHPHHYRFA